MGYTALSRAREETHLYLAAERALEPAADDLRPHQWEPERDRLWELTRDLERSEERIMSIDLDV